MALDFAAGCVGGEKREFFLVDFTLFFETRDRFSGDM